MMLKVSLISNKAKALRFLKPFQSQYQAFDRLNFKPIVKKDVRCFTVDNQKAAAQTEQKKDVQDQHGKNLEKNPYLQQVASQKATKKDINRYLLPIVYNEDTKRIFLNSMGLLALSKVLAIASPFCLKYAVNALAEVSKLDFNVAALSLLAFGGARILSTVFQELRMNQIVSIIQMALKRINLTAFTHLHQLDIYFHKISSKNTIFAINKAVKSCENALRFTLGFFMPVAFEFVLLSGTLFFYCGPTYMANMMLTFVVYTAFSKWYSSFRQAIIRKNKNNEKKSEFYLNESIMNYETVKIFNNEQLEISRYERLLNKIKNSALIIQNTLSKLNIGQTLIFSTGLTLNLLMAAWDVTNGRLTPGDFVMIQALFLQLAAPLNNMGTLFRQIDQSQVDFEDLYFLIKQQPKVKELPDAKPFTYKEGKIELKDVSFRHVFSSGKKDKKSGQITINMREDSHLLFDKLNITIQPKTTNAIVGYSGFGKTTLLNLMTRIYDPDEGSVYIDDQNIKELTFESYRKYISVVPQNGILFNDTILFNLKYGNPDCTMDEVISMCKKCQIHDKILTMENGYDTQVGDLGSKLSGGERQRILIARALLKQGAEIFIFDEATSNLDSHIERDLTDELEELLSNKTVIYCAHRLSSIVNVDNIYVMANGRVAEQGTHWELMEREGSLYSQMWKDYLREKEKETHEQIIKPDQREKKDQLNGMMMGRASKIDFTKFEIQNLPAFKGITSNDQFSLIDIDLEKWKLLYQAKLKACHRLADFTDNKKDQEFKDQKKDTLIEIIDILDDPGAIQVLFNEQVLKDAFKMIEVNLFRTFTNKASKKAASVDPDEDEPHLEEAWPHLQLVYELLLKFVMTTYIQSQIISHYITNSFIKQMLDLFDSEDPRERDYLKTILHRIYGKYMILRTPIRTQVMNLLLKVTYEHENHNGLTELLEILSSIVSGFTVPLKPEHQEFFLRVMVPLHKVKQLSNFNTQLQLCIKNFLEKDNHLCIPMIKGLLKVWPITNPAKEVIFLNEIEEIMDTYPAVITQKFQDYGPKLLKRMIKTSQSMHYQAAERSLVLLNSDTIQKLVKQNKATAYPLIVKNLISGSQQQHWNQTVITITYQVMRSYMEIDPETFEKFSNIVQEEDKKKVTRSKDIESKWAELEQKFGK